MHVNVFVVVAIGEISHLFCFASAFIFFFLLNSIAKTHTHTQIHKDKCARARIPINGTNTMTQSVWIKLELNKKFLIGHGRMVCSLVV